MAKATSETVGSARQRAEELTQAMERVEKLIGVVRDIAAKTDLLALNASIEAARAGPSGKGFAVVAHEVARLAEKSQESIEGVETVVAELKDGIGELLELIDRAGSGLRVAS